jgi:hypothetical protein
MEHRARRRGFALVIVLLIGFVAAAIATAVLSSSASTAVGAGHSAEAEIARTLALTGIERASAYVYPIEDESGDYDLLLDPLEEAICAANPPRCGTSANCNVPQYADGDIVNYNGKNYRRVAYNGGAYLTRFDDDADDLINDTSVTALWLAQTDNHANAGGCKEGSTLGYDNPFRDRNRTVLATVVGIAPGTDPTTARHRVVYRQTFTMQTAAAAVGIEVGHNLDAGNSSTNLFMCAPRGTVGVANDVRGGSSTGTCYCGDARSKNSPSWKHCDTGNIASSGCDGPSLCASGVAARPGQPTVEQKMLPDQSTTKIHASAARSEFAFDATRPCNFWVATNNGQNFPSWLTSPPKLVVWFWDAEALRGPGGSACKEIPSTTPMPEPNPTDGTGWGQCWLPVVVGDSGSPTVCEDPWRLGEVASSCAWTPKPGPRQSTAFSTGSAPFLPGGVAAPYDLPDWGAACSIDFPNQLSDRCTDPPTDVKVGSCDGLLTAMTWYESTGVYFFGPEKLGAVVPGAYYFGNNLTLTTTEQFASTLTPPATGASPLDLSLFPKATIIVDGNLEVTGRYWFGVGEDTGTGGRRVPSTDSPRRPSLIVRQAVKLNAGVVRIAGSVWVGENFEWNDTGAHTFDGELHVGNDAKFSGNATYTWNYREQLQSLSASALLEMVTAPVRAPSSE